MLSINPSLYLHIPFCKGRCTYCDFYSCALSTLGLPAKELFSLYTDKLIEQMEILRREFAVKDFSTVYIGGGTPSLMPVGELDRIIAAMDLAPSAEREVTIEVNPESLSPELLSGYEALGINRISIGIQSMDEEILKRMGRLAGRERILEAVGMLKSWQGIWSGDFIFAYPGQTAKRQIRDLREFLSLKPPHFSFYQLTVEEGTSLSNSLHKGVFSLPREEEMETAWEEGLDLIERSGYERYEISSFCREERYARHNLVYWESGRWLGLGAGAASMMEETGRFTGGSLEDFLKADERALRSGGDFYRKESLDRKDRIEEIIMMGLRTARGVDRSRLDRLLYGYDPAEIFRGTLERWMGKLILDDSSLRLNSAGLDWHSAVMVDILLDLDKFF